MEITVPPHGPQPARILVIGEFPSHEDERQQCLFSGQTGEEFLKMLQEAGFNTTDIRYTTLFRSRPYNAQMKYEWTTKKKETKDMKDFRKDGEVYTSERFRNAVNEIHMEIEATSPNVIITLGDAVLWAITGEISITKWRGSLLRYTTHFSDVKVIPTFSPAQIMRMWEWRGYAVRDLQRAYALRNVVHFPEQKFNLKIRPTVGEAHNALQLLINRANASRTPIPVVSDIETLARHIACIGFAWSKTDAICIPFIDKHCTNYYTAGEEHYLIWKMREVLLHPNIEIIGQNWAYDTQHIIRSWGFRPNLAYDTMLGQHILFPGLPKDLGFQASMYCENYVYWKDELTDYKSLPADLDRFWLYNAKDCINTFEIAEVTRSLIKRLGFVEQSAFIHRLNHHVITMMIRGVFIDRDEKSRLTLSLMDEVNKRQREIDYLVSWNPDAPTPIKSVVYDEKKKKQVLKKSKVEYNGELNIQSSAQMRQLFYEELGQKIIVNKKTHEPTTDDKALQVFAEREPILRPLIDLISETRSIGVFLSTFVLMQLDIDKRMRCSFNTGGTETYRFSSSKNAFGSGGNLQNIPSGSEEEEKQLNTFVFPNLRRMFKPDPGFILFDVDLAGADAQIVAWEADDADLKAKFRSGEKIHALNAKDIYGRDAGPDGMNKPYYKRAKMGTHLCVSGQHEALTPSGWVRVSDITFDTPILVCKAFGEAAKFEVPMGWHSEEVNTTMFHLHGLGYDQFVTADHKISYKSKKGHMGVKKAKDLTERDMLPKVCKLAANDIETPERMQLLSAFHADGSIDKVRILFNFSKQRKIERLTQILNRIQADYNIYYTANNTTMFYIKGIIAQWLITEGKKPTWKMLKYGGGDLKYYVDELVHWDGSQQRHYKYFYSSDLVTATVIHTLLHLCEYSGNITQQRNGEGILYRILFSEKAYARKITTEYPNWTGNVYCPTVSTGFWLTKHRGKIAVTGNSNYGGKPPTLSKALGISIHEAEHFQRRWFAMHPGIKTWHEHIENQLMTTRCVWNKFGFRRYYPDRLQNLLPEALAWIPQSSIAIVINKGLCAIAESGTSMELLLQVHDSLVGQMPKSETYLNLPILQDCLRVTVPYSDPLVIATSLDMSEKSWGDLKPVNWPDTNKK